MSRRHSRREPIETAFALPIGLFGMLGIGTVAAVATAADRAPIVLALTCLLVCWLSAATTAAAALALAGIGAFTVAGFSRVPIGTLHETPPWSYAAVAGAAVVGAVLGRRGRRVTGDGVTLDAVALAARRAALARVRRVAGLSTRRRVAGLLLATALLPALTAVMVAFSDHLALVDELLFYLLAVVGVTLVGGFWPAVMAALASFLLLNWFFTPPLHTWTVQDPENLLALLLFVASAVSVSSVVHLAARRGEVARERTSEAEALLALARTVLGDDSPQAVLAHLRERAGLDAVLEEQVAGTWTRIAGTPGVGPATVVPAGSAFRLAVFGDVAAASPRVLEGIAVQAASACERQRLRMQAEQSEALAAGNRMRTALLAAVSHDLRTPLASVKASVSSLRQDDVAWSDADRAELLETIEDGADQLGGLIGNLLDMSRIHTGAVQPFIRAVALDEVLPAVVRSAAAAATGATRREAAALVDVADDLPLLRTDPVLLERALANLLANAVRFSPAGRPPRITASRVPGDRLGIEIVDHGPGIPEAQRGGVFEPFQQLGDHRSVNGVGLGLAVAKGFVEAVGGSITALPTPGGGLTMRVEIPTIEAGVRPARQTDPSQRSPIAP